MRYDKQDCAVTQDSMGSHCMLKAPEHHNLTRNCQRSQVGCDLPRVANSGLGDPGGGYCRPTGNTIHRRPMESRLDKEIPCDTEKQSVIFVRLIQTVSVENVAMEMWAGEVASSFWVTVLKRPMKLLIVKDELYGVDSTCPCRPARCILTSVCRSMLCQHSSCRNI
jgi:hypothetical protein